MVTTSFWNIVVAVVIVITATPAYGFVVFVPVTCGTCITNTNTALYGRKMKRGTLGNISFSNDDDSDDNISTTKKASTAIKTRTRKKASSATKRNKKKEGNTNKNTNNKANLSTTTPSISPALAQWMETTEGQNEDTSADVIIVDSVDDDEKKEKKKGTRQRRRPRSKQLRRQDQRGVDVRQIKIDSTLDSLQEILEEKTGNVRDILNVVEELLSIDDQLLLAQPSNKSNDLRQLLMSNERTDYRLSWVGGDDAICHIGTGLHKVPLARMQEVFLNCIGSNRIEILEVISLLGPFPNVKNILQGTTRMINDKGSNADVQIVMDKMVDGTGKEILAGTDDNIRRVDLQIAFCDERVIVAVVPPEGKNKDNKINPLDDDGKRVLLFVKENKLDQKLDELRVS